MSTPSGPRTSSIAPRMAVASVPSRPSAVPPATAIFTLPCVICPASSRTPSASWRLCDTSTRLTVAIGPRQDVDRMRRPRPGSMLDLHAAGLAVGQHRIAPGGFHRFEEPAADLHREVVLLDLDAVGPGDAAASLVDFLDAHARDQAQQPHRRVTDPVRLQVTRRVVEDAGIERLEVAFQLARLVQHPEVLTDVVHTRSDCLGAGDLQQVGIVVLQHQATGGRARDDVDAFREHAQPSHVLDAVLACQVGVRVDHGRDTAALRAAADDLDPGALQHRDHLLAQASLVEIDPAAIEVSDRPSSGPHPALPQRGRGILPVPPFEPVLEGQPLILRQRPPPVDADESLHQQADERIAVPEIRERRGQAAEPAEQPRVPQQPIAQRAAFLPGALVLCAPDVLLDAHLRRAGDFTELAAGAEVEAGGHRRLLLVSVAFRFGSEELGPAEDLGRAGYGAHGVTGRALGAGFDWVLLFDGIGEGLQVLGDHAAIASCAARYPVAIAMPPRALMPVGSYPAIPPPATNTFEASGWTSLSPGGSRSLTG